MKSETMKVLEYQVIQGDKARYFSEDINGLIEQGYQPYGQLIVTSIDSSDRFYQTMVKVDENDS